MGLLGLIDKKRIASTMNMNVLPGTGRFGSKDTVVPRGIKSIKNLKEFSSAWERNLSQNSNITSRKVKLDGLS